MHKGYQFLHVPVAFLGGPWRGHFAVHDRVAQFLPCVHVGWIDCSGSGQRAEERERAALFHKTQIGQHAPAKFGVAIPGTQMLFHRAQSVVGKL